jgi:hypothetical protein
MVKRAEVALELIQQPMAQVSQHKKGEFAGYISTLEPIEPCNPHCKRLLNSNNFCKANKELLTLNRKKGSLRGMSL